MYVCMHYHKLSNYIYILKRACDCISFLIFISLYISLSAVDIENLRKSLSQKELIDESKIRLLEEENKTLVQKYNDKNDLYNNIHKELLTEQSVYKAAQVESMFHFLKA